MQHAKKPYFRLDIIEPHKSTQGSLTILKKGSYFDSPQESVDYGINLLKKAILWILSLIYNSYYIYQNVLF